MDILFPKTFDEMFMCSVINRVIDDNSNPVSNNIRFDLRTLSFIRPVGVTILSNLIEWLKLRDVTIQFIYSRDDLAYKHKALTFLDDSMFFRRYLGYKLSADSTTRETTIPLKLVSYQESYSWMEESFLYWLSGRLSLSVGSLEEIKICMFEIFNNIHDHSDQQIGSIFCQHFPKENQVNLAISDFGVGIPVNIRKAIADLSDSEAILKATEEGFTTKSSIRNAGAGLDILINNVVLINKGRLGIYSCHGSVVFRYEEGKIKSELRQLTGFYPGTLIDIHLKTDTIERKGDLSEDFEWF